MKNVHLLPTDKPSRLLLSKRGNLQFLKDNSSTNFNNHFIGTYQNIYITSNEEIKEGDYVCASGGFRFVKTLNNDKARTFKDDGIVSKQNPSNSCHLSNYKKIILTDNPDLIADGVQAIDDEFLEWFVENPSCERVEYVGDDCYYEIIIPQEEPKQEFLEKISSIDLSPEFQQLISDNWDDLTSYEPKQETLEEAAEREYKFEEDSTMPDDREHQEFIRIFKKGAKYQAERMYSEEDMRKAIQETITLMSYKATEFREHENTVIEQFKKKQNEKDFN
jgi:hypothetical protein